jgi:hypothetical protein
LGQEKEPTPKVGMLQRLLETDYVPA